MSERRAAETSRKHTPLLFRADEFDLLATLRSGQFFRWEFNGRRLILQHDADGWVLTPVPEGWFLEDGSTGRLRKFLSLDDDVFAVARQLSRLPSALRNACPGLRLLRQTPYEATIAFLLSSNNHQSRIRRMIRHITRNDGRLKSPGEIVSEHTASELRDRGHLGYRAPWLYSLADALVQEPGYLDDLARLSTPEIGTALQRFNGIGPKVAACILLFGYRRTEAFPVDVWIGRATRLHFPYTRKLSDRQLAGWAQRRFGLYAGIVQQLMFAAITQQSGRLLA